MSRSGLSLHAPARSPRLGTLVWLGFLSLVLMARPGVAQIDQLPHPDTTQGNFFGVAVSISENRALVGASSETTCDANGGAAYIFERDEKTSRWVEAARLVPRTCTPGEFFGRSVSLSGDRALVAASRALSELATASPNAAYIFERDTSGTWQQTAKLNGDPDQEEGSFAASVSLDGDRALITTWGDPSGEAFGGAAYIFERNPATGTWEKVVRLTGSLDLRAGVFGGKGVLEGDYAVVASSTYFREQAGFIYIFERNPNTGKWKEAARFGGIDDFFISLDIEGDRILVGESKDGRKDTGAASLFQRDADGKWQKVATLLPPTPYSHGAFGSEVALAGNRALVAGYDEQLKMDINIDRVVFIYGYDEDTDSWHYQNIVDIGEVAFGTAVDLDGRVALIGRASPQEAGEAYIVHIH